MAKRWLKNCPAVTPQEQSFISYWFLRQCLRYTEIDTSSAWPSEDAADVDGVVVTTAPQEFTTVGAHFNALDIGKLLAIYDPTTPRNTGIFPITGHTDAFTVTLGGACDWQTDATDLEWVMFDPSSSPALDEWAVLAPPASSSAQFQVWLSPRSLPHNGLAFQVGPKGGWTPEATTTIPGAVNDGDMELGGTAHWTGAGAVVLAKSTVQVQSGAQSLMFQSFGVGSVDSDVFNGLVDGENYDVHLWAYNSAGQPLDVRIWDGAALQFYPPIFGPAGWFSYTLNFTKVAGSGAYLQFSIPAFIPPNMMFVDSISISQTTEGHFANTPTDYVNMTPASTHIFGVGDDDHCFFWDEGGANRSGAYIGNFDPLHPPPSTLTEGDAYPSCVLGVDHAAPVLNRDTAPITSFAQGGSSVFADDTTVITCYLNEWQTADGTATDVFGDANYQTNPRTGDGVAWGTMIIHRVTPSLGARSKAVRGQAKSLYLVNANNANRALLEGDTVYVIQNGIAVAWDGSTPI